MKKLLRTFITYAVAIYLTHLVFPGLVLKGDLLKTLAITSTVFVVFNLFVRPILNLFLMPFNILTLHMLEWVVDVVIVYLVTLLIPQFSIQPFHFAGLKILGLSIPSLNVGNILAVIVCGLSIAIISHIIHWVEA